MAYTAGAAGVHQPVQIHGLVAAVKANHAAADNACSKACAMDDASAHLHTLSIVPGAPHPGNHPEGWYRYLFVTIPTELRVNYMPADSPTEDKPKQFLGLSSAQTIGSALAAVTSALVGSFLGVAGTLIGAALGSIVATVGAALYARTLSSAATIALTKIPQQRRRGLRADDGDVPVAIASAESGEPQAKPAGRRFTPKIWMKLGAVSAAAFVLAMVGLTAVEFGTNQPISSLVSSTSSIDDGAAKHTTTLGKALSGDTTVPGETDTSTEDVGQVPGQREEGSNDEAGLTSNGSPSGGDSGSTETDEPGTKELGGTLPADLAPETEQSLEPAPETGQTSEPEFFSDPGSAEQPTP